MLDPICREVYPGTRIALQVLDRDLARITVHEEAYAVISITDPQYEHPELAACEQCRSVLKLQFSDIETALKHPSPYVAACTQEIARQVAAFVGAQFAQGVRLFVVHCEAGMSRSAGVASALSQFYNGDEFFFHHHYRPNPLVRQLVLEALRESEQEK